MSVLDILAAAVLLLLVASIVAIVVVLGHFPDTLRTSVSIPVPRR